MRRPRILHVMRSPVVGGSELETLAITRLLRRFRHEVVYPAAFAGWEPSIVPLFPAQVSVRAEEDPERWLVENPPDLVHLQFPFLLHPEAPHLDSVLVFRGDCERLPAPVVFTVHAAVNVPVVPAIHYIFHTAALARRFANDIPLARTTICPSIVELPPGTRPHRGPRRGPVEILWVSRNEDAKFHDRLPAICEAVHAACPEVRFRFVGVPVTWRLPEWAWSASEPCPSRDLEAAWAAADIFWYFPAPHLEETWCRTVTEAMLHGLPCVVAGHGAMRDQVRDGIEGFVVEDADACGSALIELVRSPALRGEMGGASAARARVFHQEALTTLDALYGRLAGAAALSERSDAAASTG